MRGIFSLAHASTILLGFWAVCWVAAGIRVGIGMMKIPRLRNIQPPYDLAVPRISIVFAARDESEKLPAAVSSMLALDYPDYEVIAVNDRSNDGTEKILDEFARRDSRLRVTHISELPPGWLGKPHALNEAARVATGDWLLFTDADVYFAPDALRRSMALAKQKRWDHLTLLADMDMRGFWEKTAIGFFTLCLIIGYRIWRVSDPRSRAWMGVGAFQLVRRAAYEASGTHQRLAMEVIDDVRLGKIIKHSGFASGVATADGLVKVRWQDGFGNVVRGVTKNLFAGFGFHVWQAAGAVALILLLNVAPFAGIFLTHGLARIFLIVIALVPVIMQGELMHEAHASRLYGLTHPLGALIFIYMLVRSMVVTLWRGGVVWRGTFYPLDELRRGKV
jgi:hypothetical protein